MDRVDFKVVVTALYSLVLNAAQDAVDKDLFKLLVVDYFLSDEILSVLQHAVDNKGEES